MVAPTAGQQSKLERRGTCSKAVFFTGRLNKTITRPEVRACQHKSVTGAELGQKPPRVIGSD